MGDICKDCGNDAEGCSCRPPTFGARLVRATERLAERRPWPDPTPDMLADPAFNAVWDCIKRWDINVPDAYGGYMGATGNHVRAILDALAEVDGRR